MKDLSINIEWAFSVVRECYAGAKQALLCLPRVTSNKDWSCLPITEPTVHSHYNKQMLMVHYKQPITNQTCLHVGYLWNLLYSSLSLDSGIWRAPFWTIASPVSKHSPLESISRKEETLHLLGQGLNTIFDKNPESSKLLGSLSWLWRKHLFVTGGAHIYT